MGRNTPGFVLNSAEWFKKVLLEPVGRGDSDWAGDSATRRSVTGYHCDVQNVTKCIRSLKQTAISLRSCEAEFYAASACAGELLGIAEFFKELHCTVSVRLEMDSDSARTLSAAQETRWTPTHRDTMLGNTTMDTRETSICESSGHKEEQCRSLHETSGWTANTIPREETWTSKVLSTRWVPRESTRVAADDKMQADSPKRGDPGSRTSENGNELQTARPTRAEVSDEVAQEFQVISKGNANIGRSAGEPPE